MATDESAGIATGDSPAAPVVSPDGRFYLVNGEWVPMPGGAVPAVVPSSKPRLGGVLILVAAAVAGVGALSPWLEATMPLVGTVTRTGLDGDGMVVLVAAGLAAIAGVISLVSGARWPAAVAVLAALVCFGVVGADGGDISARVAKVNAVGSGATASIAFGFYLVGVGGVALIVAAIVALAQKRA